MATNNEVSDDLELTEAQLQRIEKNKQRALTIKKSRLIPYDRQGKTPVTQIITKDKATIKIGTTTFKDSGGGFLLEEEPDQAEHSIKITEDIPPVFEPERPTCEKCKKLFATSWLFNNFDCRVCDECKDPEEHRLIAKTEAKKEYLLNDCDIDKREPILKFITRPNPHNPRWGTMKLYLQIQVEQRALDIHGSEEKIEELLEEREEKKVIQKTKKYNKQMKELRMTMRSSLFDRTTAGPHTHAFGPDTYCEDEDNYSHTCLTCGYEETFEKM